MADSINEATDPVHVITGCDNKFLALNRELDKAARFYLRTAAAPQNWRMQIAAEARVDGIAEKISVLPATSYCGLAVKVRASLWTMGFDTLFAERTDRCFRPEIQAAARLMAEVEAIIGQAQDESR